MYDILDREYFGKPEIFAELIEVGVLKRKVKIDARRLVGLEGKYPSLRSKSGEYERDEIKLYEEHKVKYGIELENHTDYGMPRRMIVYDAGEYEKAAAERKKRHNSRKTGRGFEEIKSGMVADEKDYPVINLVLYLGMGRYKGPRCLRESFGDIPVKVRPYLNDKIQNYSFSLMEADYVNPNSFDTELKQFFEAMQARNDKKKMLELIDRDDYQKLSDETKKIISIHLDNDRLTKKVVEEDVEMCKAIRDMLRDSEEKGKDEVFVLYSKLRDSNRLDDWDRATMDQDYRNRLIEEFMLKNVDLV